MSEEILHEPVLLEETLALLLRPVPGIWVDATTGAGGHASEVLRRHPGARLLGLDRDPEALRAARARLAAFGERCVLLHADFRDLRETLKKTGSDGRRESSPTSASPRCTSTTPAAASPSAPMALWT